MYRLCKYSNSILNQINKCVPATAINDKKRETKLLLFENKLTKQCGKTNQNSLEKNTIAQTFGISRTEGIDQKTQILLLDR